MSSTASSRRRASSSARLVALRSVTLRLVSTMPWTPGSSSRFVAVVSISTQPPSACRKRQSDHVTTPTSATKLDERADEVRVVVRVDQVHEARPDQVVAVPSSRSSVRRWRASPCPRRRCTATASEQAPRIVSQRVRSRPLATAASGARRLVPIIVVFPQRAHDVQAPAEVLGDEVRQPALRVAVELDELQRRTARRRGSRSRARACSTGSGLSGSIRLSRRRPGRPRGRCAPSSITPSAPTS